MIERMSKRGEIGIEPLKGTGIMHYRFHGGAQSKLNRVVLLGSGTFVELQKGMEALLGSQADAIFYEAGIRSGKEAQATLETDMTEKGDALIRRVFGVLEEGGYGWFKVTDLRIDSEAKRGSVTVFNSFISDTYHRAPRPVCHFIAGFIAGLISTIWNVEITCEETACSSVGGNNCVFEWEAIQ